MKVFSFVFSFLRMEFFVAFVISTKAPEEQSIENEKQYSIIRWPMNPIRLLKPIPFHWNTTKTHMLSKWMWTIFREKLKIKQKNKSKGKKNTTKQFHDDCLLLRVFVYAICLLASFVVRNKNEISYAYYFIEEYSVQTTLVMRTNNHILWRMWAHHSTECSTTI